MSLYLALLLLVDYGRRFCTIMVDQHLEGHKKKLDFRHTLTVT